MLAYWGIVVFLLAVIGVLARKKRALQAELAGFRALHSDYERLENDLKRVMEGDENEITWVRSVLDNTFGAAQTYSGGATRGSAVVRAAGDAAWEDLAEDRLIEFKTFEPLKKYRSSVVKDTNYDEEEDFNLEDLIPNLNVVSPASKSQA